MYQQIYNYGHSPQQQQHGHHEDNSIEMKGEDLFYDERQQQQQQQYQSNMTNNFNHRYSSFDLNAYDPHSQQQQQQQQQQQHDMHYNQGRSSQSEDQNSIHNFHGFQTMNSPGDIVATLSNPPHQYDSVDMNQTSSVNTSSSILPPLNTTPIIMAPLQHHQTTSHQTYLLAQKKPLKGSPRPSRERAPWTPEEDNLLKLAVQLYGDKTEKWAKIAACVPGRTNKNCRKRWFHSLDPSLRKGAWTEEEDQLLREGVSKYPNQWSKIADMLPGRTDDQCAKRWRESLDPSIDRSEWTTMEDALLMEKYEEYGSQWQKIAHFFDGRPGLHCRNRWRKLQRMVQIKKEKEGATMNAPFFNTLAEEQTIRFQHTSQPNTNTTTMIQSNNNTPMHTNNNNNSVHSTHTNTNNNNTNNTTLHQQSYQLHLTHLLSQQQQQHDPSVLVQFSNANNEEYQDYENAVKPFGCDVPGCFSVFSASTGLFYHMKNIHPHLEGVDKPYRCAMVNCSKKYKNINGLQYHIKDAKGTTGHGGGGTHLGAGNDDRPFRCMIASCKKAYRTASGFRYHQQNGHNIQTAAIQPHLLPSRQPQEQLQQQQQFRMKREKWVMEGV